jgi:hypothetical protein
MVIVAFPPRIKDKALSGVERIAGWRAVVVIKVIG